MRTAHDAHPLRPVLDTIGDGPSAVLDSFDDLIGVLESTAPSGWEGKRREFRKLRQDRQFYGFRAELVIAAKVARSGGAFAIGRAGTPNPDLVLESGLGIEVTARAPEGVEDLYEEIEAALAGVSNASVSLRFSEYPIRVRESDRRALIEDIMKIAVACDATGRGDIAQHTVEDDLNGSVLTIQADVLPVPTLAFGLRVTWETDAGELTAPLDAVGRHVLSVLHDPRKLRQGDSMSTILAVDISRLGPAWMRPPGVWAHALGDILRGVESPFAAIAVFVPSMDTSDCEIAIRKVPGINDQASELVDELAALLDLIPC